MSFGLEADDAQRRQPEALDAPLHGRTRKDQMFHEVSTLGEAIYQIVPERLAKTLLLFLTETVPWPVCV